MRTIFDQLSLFAGTQPAHGVHLRLRPADGMRSHVLRH